MATWVGLIVCELFVPGAVSLKDKRRAVKSFVDRVHRRFRVSVAETGLHDLHQRSEISMAVVSASEAEVERLVDALRRMGDELHEAVISRWDAQVIEGVG